MGLTREQTSMAMVINGKIGGALSIGGSVFIIRHIYTRWQNKRDDEYLPIATCLILSMSIGDIGSSFFAFFLGSWMVPAEGGFPLAAGNEASCTAQASLFGIFWASGISTNALLALTYWLTICRGKTEKHLRTWRWKALLFGFPWIFGLVYSTAARAIIDPTEWPMAWYCYGLLAEPGTLAGDITAVVILVYVGVLYILIFYSMAKLVQFVLTQERSMDRFRLDDGGNNREKTIQVGKQALAYTAAWMVVMTPMLVVAIYTMLLGGGDFSQVQLPNWYYIFYSAIFPLQGLLNACVYFRPKVVAARQRDQLARFAAIAQVLDISVPTQLSEQMRSFRTSLSFSIGSRGNSQEAGKNGVNIADGADSDLNNVKGAPT